MELGRGETSPLAVQALHGGMGRRTNTLLLSILLIGLILGMTYALYITGTAAYNQLRTLMTRLTGASTRPVQTGNNTACYIISSSEGLALEATLSYGSKRVSVAMIVDTGAYISASPLQLAHELGINPYSGSPVSLGSVYGQTQLGYVHTISLTLPNMATVQIPIAIMLSSSVPYVLGRQGFLNQFTLDVGSGTFCLKQ